MTTEELNDKLQKIPNTELISKVEELISNLCKTGGKCFTMSVPVRETDSDMLLTEFIKRFKDMNYRLESLDK